MKDAVAEATVLDTSVLSNFAHVDRMGALTELPRPATVQAVRSELEAGVGTHPYLERAVNHLDDGIPVIAPDSQASELEAQLQGALDPGDAQALAVAETSDGMIVTDDGDARTIAAERSLPATGSIGLLVRFVQDGSLTADTADTCLKRWIDEAGFRLPARDIDIFLQE